MRVAVIHYWLVGMRGGERVLEEILALFPRAEIFTHVADLATLSDRIRAHPVHETAVARLPGARRHYQKYLGFMPRALEELDLSGFDLVISSESGPAKGVIVPPGVPHVAYVHSPMRYIWDHYPAYRARLGPVGRLVFSRVAHRMRQWDVTSAARVDRIVANSAFVAGRIRRFWRRDADVVHPPVDLERFRPAPPGAGRRHFLFVSELVPYKRADLVIEAFRHLDLPLLVVGDGPERARLGRNLPGNVRLLGRVPGDELAALYQGARALVFPAEEDFGITPVEAMASGTPVIAYGRGGATESVIDGTTGLFFASQTPDDIVAAVHRFLEIEPRFDSAGIAAHARRFSPARFRAEFLRIVEEELARTRGSESHGSPARSNSCGAGAHAGVGGRPPARPGGTRRGRLGRGAWRRHCGLASRR